MTTQNQVPEKPSFGRQLWLAFKRLVLFVFRVLLIVLIIAAVGAAIYFGGPVLVDEYLLKDVRQNSTKIDAIDAQLTSESERINQELEDLQTRIDALEIQGDTDVQTIDNLKVQIAAAESTLLEQAPTLENIVDLGTDLELLSTALAALDEKVSTIEVLLDDVFIGATTTNESIESLQTEVETLNALLEARDTVDTLRQDLTLLKVMELITRARVSIGQENTGLAKDDLQAAQDLLTDLRSEVTAEQASYLDDISQRLSLASKNLTESQNLVDADLEVAWQLLLQGLPDTSPAGEEAEQTPTPESETSGDAEDTPTPTPTPKP